MWSDLGKQNIQARAVYSRGRGYSIYAWVGRCGPAPYTLTLSKTKIADFPTLFKTEFRFLIPCLRHLTRNHTLCKTIINIETLSYLIHWQSQNYLQLDWQSHEELLTVDKIDTVINTKNEKIDTLFKTKNDKIDTLFKRKILKNIPWLAGHVPIKPL